MFFVPREVLVVAAPIRPQGVACRYSLLTVPVPGGPSVYFMSVYRRNDSGDAFQVSPVLGTGYGEALGVFRRVAEAPGGVHPVHLVDVVQDLLLERSPEPQALAGPGAAASF